MRTDKPEAELALYRNSELLCSANWEAHRKLAETIHVKLDQMLKAEKISLKDIGGVVIYKGPGSFTGLRIGFSVANALADSLNIPIYASGGNTWQQLGIESLLNGQGEKIVAPEYGAPAKTTTQKK